MRDRLGHYYGDLWEDPRRRARLILLILAMTAALVVAIMVLLVGTSTGHHDTGLGEAAPTSQPTTAGQPTTGTQAATASGTPSTSTSAAPKPTSTANPCPSSKPCAVPGDSGGAVGALNAFRTSHGRKAVSGGATVQAQQCALGRGSGPACQPHYAWQPVATQDGSAAISKIARQDGGAWLLDPAMSSFSVGWAYTPGPGGASGSYQFAVLKVG